jgi:GDP-L-fucose synthase
MDKEARIYVAGHRGMVGSAIVRLLQQQGFTNVVVKTREELDLRNQKSVVDFFEEARPEYVFVAAAKVGGIHANNTYRAEFIYDNLMIASNLIHQSYVYGVKKLLFLGSSCIYPKHAPQPLKESYLLTGPLEPTNEPYAVAKIAGIKLCENYRLQYGCNFISAMPCNLYGPNDNYHPENSHVIPALLRKFHEAKQRQLPQVTIWGSGNALREFLHVDDLAAACLHLMQHYNDLPFVNVGSGEEISIRDLAYLIKEITGYTGELIFDTNYPDGTPRKVLDSSVIRGMGWKPEYSLREGIAQVYRETFVS